MHCVCSLALYLYFPFAELLQYMQQMISFHGRELFLPTHEHIAVVWEHETKFPVAAISTLHTFEGIGLHTSPSCLVLDMSSLCVERGPLYSLYLFIHSRAAICFS